VTLNDYLIYTYATDLVTQQLRPIKVEIFPDIGCTSSCAMRRGP
jgi:hypothetical protein